MIKLNCGKKTKFFTQCVGFCNITYHWSLGVGEKTYTDMRKAGIVKEISLSTLGAKKSKGKYVIDSNVISKLQPGDFIHWKNHYALYVGDGEIVEMINYGKPSWSSWTLKYRSVKAYNGYSNFKGIYRITEKAAESVDVTKIPSEYIPADLLSKIMLMK